MAGAGLQNLVEPSPMLEDEGGPGTHRLRQFCRWEASWCRTVSSFSALMGALQQVSREACFRDAESVQCASRR